MKNLREPTSERSPPSVTRSRDPPEGNVSDLPGFFGIGPSPMYRNFRNYRMYVTVPCPLWYPSECSPQFYEYVIVRGSPDQELNGLYLRDDSLCSTYRKWEDPSQAARTHGRRQKRPNVADTIDIMKRRSGEWLISKWDGYDNTPFYESRDNI